jgi:alkylation response protein AidB-like acyl-CoA dehydrogenase
MHVQLESARSISRAAARALAADDPDAARLSRMAKAWCGDALDLIAGETIQLHGGIGITWEHDAQLVFKRAHALSQLFGQASDQRAQLATALGLT